MLDMSEAVKELKDVELKREQDIIEHRARGKQIIKDRDSAILKMCAEMTPNNSLEHKYIELEPACIGGNSIEDGKIRVTSFSLYICLKYSDGRSGFLKEMRADFGFEYDVKKKIAKPLDLGKGIVWHALYCDEKETLVEALARSLENWHDIFEMMDERIELEVV